MGGVRLGLLFAEYRVEASVCLVVLSFFIGVLLACPLGRGDGEMKGGCA